MILNASGYDTVSHRLNLLWTNDNPTAAFAASKAITLDLNGYDFLYIELLLSTTYTYRTLSIIKNDSTLANQCIAGTGGEWSVKRLVTITNTGLTFSTGYYTRMEPLKVSNGSGTTYAIPYRIYGSMREEVPL